MEANSSEHSVENKLSALSGSVDFTTHDSDGVKTNVLYRDISDLSGLSNWASSKGGLVGFTTRDSDEVKANVLYRDYALFWNVSEEGARCKGGSLQ
ncbi:hypothetical protein GCK32_012792 [Trichostrongylus colubriformis]|uniref:Uncharacterized protein n=1 Tax=Trichostrongylus colubriformis TaxID=6319 RepID=A0AAN8IX16_TRICO